MQVQKINHQQSFGMNLKIQGRWADAIMTRNVSDDAINILAETQAAVNLLEPKNKDVFLILDNVITEGNTPKFSTSDNSPILIKLYTEHQAGKLKYKTEEFENLPKVSTYSEICETSGFIQKIVEMAKKISNRYSATEKAVKQANDLIPS